MGLMRDEFSIVISLRNDMFELAHRLVGIYKTSNVSLSSGLSFNKKLTRCTSVQRVLRLTTRISDYKHGQRDRLVYLLPHRARARRQEE